MKGPEKGVPQAEETQEQGTPEEEHSRAAKQEVEHPRLGSAPYLQAIPGSCVPENWGEVRG